MRGRRSAVGAAELGDGECGTRARRQHYAIVGCSQQFRGQVEVVAFVIQNELYVFEHSTCHVGLVITVCTHSSPKYHFPHFRLSLSHHTHDILIVILEQLFQSKLLSWITRLID